MEFFNPEEEVLDIELTSYGKQLLSDGKFKPKYYSFSDENVIYNIQRSAKDGGSITQEERNNTATRITEDTPYIKVNPNKLPINYSDTINENPVIANLSTDSANALSDIISQKLKRFSDQKNNFETTKAKANSLGSLSTGNTLSPGMKIFIASSKLESAKSFFVPSNILEYNNHDTVNIPQIDVDMTLKSTIVDLNNPYDVSVPLTDFELENQLLVSSNQNLIGVLDNGIPIYKVPDLFIVLEESHGVASFYDTYEIEAYVVEDTTSTLTNNKEIRKLDRNLELYDLETRDNKLLSQEEKSEIFYNNSSVALIDIPINDPNKLNYYLDIFTDSNGLLAGNSICNYVEQLKALGFAADLFLDCPDKVPQSELGFDQYITNTGISENCP